MTIEIDKQGLIDSIGVLRNNIVLTARTEQLLNEAQSCLEDNDFENAICFLEEVQDRLTLDSWHDFCKDIIKQLLILQE